MMKRMLAFLVATVLAFPLMACAKSTLESPSIGVSMSGTDEIIQEPKISGSSMADKIPTNEYERAVWYGFLPQDLEDAPPESTVVTWAQYCEILGRMIKSYIGSAYPTWEEMTKDAPGTEMKRDGAMVSLIFAGETMGLLNFNVNSDESYSKYDYGHKLQWNYPVFDWQKPVSIIGGETYSNHVAPSFEYCTRRVSCVSNLSLLETIDDDGDLRLGAPFTLREALLSAVRLYESDEQVALKLADMQLVKVKQDPGVQDIIQAAEKRKQEILNTETLITKSEEFIQGETYTGTAYYVSNNGDDNADGLTPETAWATISRLSNVAFRFGDAIFFERGSTWRNVDFPASIRQTEGLTLSAYGKGDKPRFLGSPENGAGEDKWSLYYEGADGKKIWLYHMEMTDCAVAVLPTAGSYIKRDVAFWNGTEFTCLNDHTKPYLVEEQLDNMELFSAVRYAKQPYDPESLFLAGWNDVLGISEYLTGPLYLRCDNGNPGELYDEIEFSTAHTPFDGLPDHTTIDNLCFRYFGRGLAVGCVDGISTDYCTMQNSESGWIGGALKWYSEECLACLGYVWMDGGCFNINGSYETVKNNYFHHGFQESLALETFTDDKDPCCNNTIADNVLEYSVMGLIVVNWDQEVKEPHTFSNILIENNYSLYSGFENYYNVTPRIINPDLGNVHWPNRIGYLMSDSACYNVVDCPNAHDGTLEVKNNVFAFGASQLIKIGFYSEEYSRVFDGNTYAQLPGLSWFTTFEVNHGPRPRYLDPKVAVNDWICDKNATIVEFD